MAHYVRELTTRKYRGKPPAPIRGPDDDVHVVGRRLRQEKREHFIVLLLNARHEIEGQEVVSRSVPWTLRSCTRARCSCRR